MIELAERLEDLGHAYATDAGNVYYDVAAFPGYGRAVGQHRSTSFGPATAARSSRTSATPPTSRSGRPPARAASSPGRRRAGATGFPGWHLECSAMALRYLGRRFDIHTGGVDNVFPHHEDEIAQSAPSSAARRRGIWVHGEHLLMAGRKMAKSAGQLPAGHRARRARASTRSRSATSR